MTRMVAIVEGYGDEKALPSLIAKTSLEFGHEVIAPQPIRVGGWPKLRQEGQLERWCRLAASRDAIDAILVVVDLDDDCPKAEYEANSARIDAISASIGIPVRLCFCVREFECWLLESLPELRAAFPDINWNPDNPENPAGIRDAKGTFEKILGSRYRETVDQERFSKKIDPKRLYAASRSFRKFVKSVCGVDYNDLAVD